MKTNSVEKVDGVATAVGYALNIAGTVMPLIGTAAAAQIAPILALGKLVAVAAPEIYEDIVKLCQKAEPTPDEEKALREKIAALARPEVIVKNTD